MTELLSLNDDCLCYVMLFLAVPDAHSLAATHTVIRAVLDERTIELLVAVSIPSFLDMKARFPLLSAKDFYRDFYNLKNNDTAYKLDDFRFSIKLNDGAWHLRTPTTRVSGTYYYDPGTGIAFDFDLPPFMCEIGYEIALTDMRTGRTKVMALLDDGHGEDYTTDSPQELEFYMRLYSSPCFDVGVNAQLSSAYFTLASCFLCDPPAHEHSGAGPQRPMDYFIDNPEHDLRVA